jgi:anaerobic selenocysteine-containing dehydrogenase
VSNQAIAPLGECRSNVGVFRALALRMGFEEECFRESVDEMIEVALDSSSAWLEGLSRERLEQGPVRLNFEGSGGESASAAAELGSAGQLGAALPTHSQMLGAPFLPFAYGGFGTASGKAELYSEAVKGLGLDPVADFTPPAESRHGNAGKTLPLELLARKADNFLNSTFSNVPSVQEMEETGMLEICEEDARARSIRSGDRVRVFNRRGEILLRASVAGTVQPGVVSARLNWAKMTPGFQSINALTSEKLTDMGNSATFYSVLVEVELAKPSP